MAETDVRSRQPRWTFGCRLGQAEGAALTYEANGVVHCAYHFCSKDAVCGISSSALISSSAFSPALYYSHEELLAGDPVPPEGRARGIAAEAELEVGGVCCGGVEACVDVVLGGVAEDGGGVGDGAGVLDGGVRLLGEGAERGGGGGGHGVEMWRRCGGGRW